MFDSYILIFQEAFPGFPGFDYGEELRPGEIARRIWLTRRRSSDQEREILNSFVFDVGYLSDDELEETPNIKDTN